MVDKKIRSQLIPLMKEIKLLEPADNKGLKNDFFAGKNPHLAVPRGIVFYWWHTKKTFDLAKTIASFAISKYINLKNGEVSEFAAIIIGIFPKICLDNRLFNIDDVLNRKKENLFETRAILCVDEFIGCLWEILYEELRISITKWCFIIPVPKVQSQSFSLCHDGLSVVQKSDTNVWIELANEYPSLKFLDANTGVFDGKPSSFTNLNYDIYLVCHCEGTSNGARFNASLKLKRFLSVMFAAMQGTHEKGFLLKSGASPYKVCMQFAHRNSESRVGIICAELGAILPHYISNYTLDQEVIISIKNWYHRYSQSDDRFRNKVKKAAHFINHGMNSNDIESFLNYFISLDALFGERGDVERLILKGVKASTSSDNCEQRAKWLFDLRSELVHGGSRNVAEWNKYDRYLDHFKSSPELDVRKLALTCLLVAFDTLPQLNE
ncbi:MAG: hypothetical protein KKB51_06215 [Candidatus Riflebacteria bacterium]|nr:hypothetical protein [Candidatus Riflebacteria bacterium]